MTWRQLAPAQDSMLNDVQSPPQGRSEEELVAEFRPLVEKLAARLKRKLKLRIEQDDLIAYGMAGLLQATRRYDQSRAASFSSFAYYRIQGAMYDGCRKEGWAPRERTGPRVRALATINEQLSSHHEAQEHAPEARTLSESLDRASQMIGDVLTILYIDGADMEAAVGQQRPTQHRAMEQTQQNERLASALSQLDETEQTLIRRHHFFEEPLSSIAQELGLSPSWCSRIHARALTKLREVLLESGLESTG